MKDHQEAASDENGQVCYPPVLQGEEMKEKVRNQKHLLMFLWSITASFGFSYLKNNV